MTTSLDALVPAASPAAADPGRPAHGPATVSDPERTRARQRPWLWVLGTVIPIVCSAGLFFLGHGVEPADDLARTLSARFEAPVTCDADLPGTTGATTVCIGRDADGTVHHVLVTVTGTHGFRGRTIDYQAVVQD